MMSRLVTPAKFHADLDNFYLSKYLISELQDYYTVKEQEAFRNGRLTESKNRAVCKKSWPICYCSLEKNKNLHENHTILLTTHFILSNFHLGHFIGRKKSIHEESAQKEATPQNCTALKMREEDLLIERQRHTCECRDHELDKLKSEVRQRISAQLSHPDRYRSSTKFNGIVKQDSMDVNQYYANYMKGKRNTNISYDDKSDYSQSINSKPSHDITNYQNTRSLLLPSVPVGVQRGPYRHPRLPRSEQS